jgi:hypothetical protein
MIEYLRTQARRCQQLSRTSLDLSSSTAFRLMAEEHLRRAELEEERAGRRIHGQQQS